MTKEHRSFSERTYKTNIFSGGLSRKVSPMTMIIDQIKRDSMKPVDEQDDTPDDGPEPIEGKKRSDEYDDDGGD